MVRPLVFVAFLALGLIFVKSTVASSNDLTVGAREGNDSLVHEENINEKASIIGRKVILEKTFNAPPNNVITLLRAMDKATGNTGASVVVIKGGPGQESITLRFKSQRFHGIHFNVQIYAKRRY